MYKRRRRARKKTTPPPIPPTPWPLLPADLMAHTIGFCGTGDFLAFRLTCQFAHRATPPATHVGIDCGSSQLNRISFRRRGTAYETSSRVSCLPSVKFMRTIRPHTLALLNPTSAQFDHAVEFMVPGFMLDSVREFTVLFDPMWMCGGYGTRGIALALGPSKPLLQLRTFVIAHASPSSSMQCYLIGRLIPNVTTLEVNNIRFNEEGGDLPPRLQHFYSPNAYQSIDPHRWMPLLVDLKTWATPNVYVHFNGPAPLPPPKLEWIRCAFHEPLNPDPGMDKWNRLLTAAPYYANRIETVVGRVNALCSPLKLL
jgi:hypothetical protein